MESRWDFLRESRNGGKEHSAQQAEKTPLFSPYWLLHPDCSMNNFYTSIRVCEQEWDSEKMNIKQSNIKWRNENYRGKLKDFDFRDMCLWVPWYPMPFVCCLPTSIPHPSLLFSPATPSSDLPLPLSLLLLPLNPPPLLLPLLVSRKLNPTHCIS